MSKLSFSEYDCVGFDLDMALASYKLTNYYKFIYEHICNYLVKENNYSVDFLLQPVDLDFPIKGLIIDDEHGNLLRVSVNGKVLKATHGTKWLTTEEILVFYQNGHWSETDIFVQDPTGAYNKNIMKVLPDYLHIVMSLIFARCVDSIDKLEGQKINYQILPDVVRAIYALFFGRGLRETQQGVFPLLEKHPTLIFHRTSEKVLEWIKELKQNGKKLFLITGADIGFADLTASTALGKDWKKYFDIIICFCDKSRFFKEEDNFIENDGFKDLGVINSDNLKQGGIYIAGNWKGLKKFLVNLSQKPTPKMVYIGDNVISDIYAPKIHAQIDTICICEELSVEKDFNITGGHPDEKFLSSNLWGSFFTPSENNEKYFLESLLEKADIVVPNIEFLAKHPINHKFEKNVF